MTEFPLPVLQIWRSRKQVAIQIQLMNIRVSECKYYCLHLVPKFGDMCDRQNWRLHPTDCVIIQTNMFKFEPISSKFVVKMVQMTLKVKVTHPYTIQTWGIDMSNYLLWCKFGILPKICDGWSCWQSLCHWWMYNQLNGRIHIPDKQTLAIPFPSTRWAAKKKKNADILVSLFTSQSYYDSILSVAIW